MSETISKIKEKIRNWLNVSPHFHIREENVNSLGDLVDLIDRFNDGFVKYDLEWDDFISWEHKNPYIEEVRQRIGEYEYLLFSSNKSDRIKYGRFLVEERNKIAAIIGIDIRNPDDIK